MAQTTPPVITTPPAQPERGNRATFSGLVDAFVSWLIAAVAQFGAVATNCYNNAVDAYNSAVAAALSAAAAASSAAAALATANAALWVSGTTYAKGVNAISLANGRTYRRQIAGAGTTDPSLDLVNWIDPVLGPRISPRTANAILTATDLGSYVDITSGTFTQTFTAAATLGIGWFCRVGNSGTGDITIPSSDGVTNWIMYPGEVRDFYCDGSVFTSRIIHSYRRDFISSGMPHHEERILR